MQLPSERTKYLVRLSCSHKIFQTVIFKDSDIDNDRDALRRVNGLYMATLDPLRSTSRQTWQSFCQFMRIFSLWDLEGIHESRVQSVQFPSAS
jgi:hypothetical protein